MFPPVHNFCEIFSIEDSTISYLIQQQVIVKPNTCWFFGGDGIVLNSKTWRSCKLKVQDALELSYLLLVGVKSKQMCMITGHSSATISNYGKHLRQLVADSLDYDNLIIGGPGIIVEIDESKFGKNKNHRGLPVNGAWVLGGVERTEERKMFLIEVPGRTAETLINIIKTYVREGSTIFTDCFSSYNQLHQHYNHFKVNHSIEFVDSTTGIHTNTIEGSWSAVKYKISPRNRTSSINEDGVVVEGGIHEFLLEFQWRRKNQFNL